jgi:DNA polymerase-1
MSKRVLLIDGDVLVYKVAFASEQVIDWGDDLHTLHSDAGQAASAIDCQINTIREQLDGDEVVVALTCHNTPNFRKSFFPTYKENRTVKRKPIVWAALRLHLVEKWSARIKSNLEADDVLGILSTMPRKRNNEDRIIVSIDKDFKTIPGLFYNLKDGKSGQMQDISEEMANYNFMLQTLIGDSVDNYPGCQGIGPKTAAKLLLNAKTLSDAWKVVLKTFSSAGFGGEYALTQARCARILRSCDYDFKNKQPILWSPPE